MKHRVTLIVLALLFLSNVLYAQTPTYAFKVLMSKGKSEVKSASVWEPLKIGTPLKASDEIRVSENSYLGLLHADGQPIEIREAKTYKVSELVKKVPRGATALNKYTDFILSKQEEKKDRLSATGAVERTIKDVVIIYLPGPEKSDFYGSQVTLNWISDDVKPPYEIVFSNLLGDELGRYETDKDWISLPINEGKFKNEFNIMVKVVSKNTPGQGSKDYVIKRLKPADREKYAGMFEVKGNSALDQYILAGAYEENFLLIDALNAYHEASALAPDVELYKTAYEEFVKRLGFVEEEEK